MSRAGSILVVLIAVHALACSRQDATPTDTIQDSATAAKPPVGASTASVPAPEANALQPTQPGLQLQEILYRPRQGAAPFIEIANASAEAVPLARITLRIDSSFIPLERVGEKLAPGERMLVILDGPSRASGMTYHAGDGVAISANEGRVAILDSFGRPIDEVAWGRAAGAVNPVGGGARLEMEPGASIGRPPGASTPRRSSDWVGYAPNEVTPGAANPPVAVRGLHPMSGAAISREGAAISWFPVPGAAGYRVQVAADDAFSKVVIEQSVTRPPVDISGLSAGRYVWRVQSQFDGTAAAGYSEPSAVVLTDEASTTTAIRQQRGSSRMAGLLRWVRDIPGFIAAAYAQTPVASGRRSDTACDRTIGYQPLSRSVCVLLRVPLISQHKDTKMLLLEHPFSSGIHAWDVDHGSLDEADPSDNANCGLASLAMMNHYASGDLSQDRIGYEILKDRSPANGGPEGDVMYGDGLLDDPEMITAYAYALGTAATLYRPINPGAAADYPERVWVEVKKEIDANRPMLVFSQSRNHYMVVVGYEIVDDSRVIIVNDPWPGKQVKFNLGDADARASIAAWEIYLPAGNFTAKSQEASVLQDSDGDGVVDFDETRRFRTHPNNNDTDNDGVGDKQDIFASVFDPVYGYALHGSGRDEDRDGKPMELDSDSDEGGCKDGEEDENGNGIHEGMVIQRPETWNFKFIDDSCRPLTGHLTWHVHSSMEVVPGIQWGEVVSSTSVNVRLKPMQGAPGNFEDDGSTFHYSGWSRGVTEAPQCRMIGLSWAAASGDFTGPDAGLVTAYIGDDGRLAVHFVAGIPEAQVQGYADMCGLGGAGPGASHSAEFYDECAGDPVLPGQQGYVPGHRIFRFNCHDTYWSASGTVIVP